MAGVGGHFPVANQPHRKRPARGEPSSNSQTSHEGYLERDTSPRLEEVNSGCPIPLSSNIAHIVGGLGCRTKLFSTSGGRLRSPRGSHVKETWLQFLFLDPTYTEKQQHVEKDSVYSIQMIEWEFTLSQAHSSPVCMHAGGPPRDGSEILL